MKYLLITTILSLAGFIAFPEKINEEVKVQYIEFEPMIINISK